MDRTELYLKTAFCCLACDGEVAPEEVEKIKTLPPFKEMDLQQFLSDYSARLKLEGAVFLKKYLNEIKAADLTESEELELANTAIQIIEADKQVEYREVAFFKKIRKCLQVSDEKLLAAIPENPAVANQIAPEDYLLPDIIEDMSMWDDMVFSDIIIAQN